MPSVRGFLDRVNPWHAKAAASPPPPPITTRTALLLLGLYALIYVLPFYLSKLTRPSAELSRDAPSVIKARIRSVAISCVICCLCTYAILVRDAHAAHPEALHLMGLWPVALVDSSRALFLTAVLFAGPLFKYFLVDGGAREWRQLQPVKTLWQEWTVWRNIVAGPITEEVLFRTASIPLMLIARAPVRQTIFLSPVVFGLAHFHHFYEFRLSNPGVPFAAALARSVFQLGFTALFGAYATFVYLRTGSLLAVCAIHAFCNCMGPPRVWGRVTPILADGREGGGSRAWTAAYYLVLVSGAVVWWKHLWTWTESANPLMPTAAFLGEPVAGV